MFAIKPSKAEVDMFLPQIVKCGGLLAEFPGDPTAFEAVTVAVAVAGLAAVGEGFVPGPIAFEVAVVVAVSSGKG